MRPPIEDVETFRDSNTTGVLDTSYIVDFYERLQAICHQMGLDSNQTSAQASAPDVNTTQTLKFVIHVLPTVPKTTPFVNFLYLWVIIMIVCIGILGSIAIYKNAPQYLQKIQGSIMRHKGPLTKGKDMKQDLTSAV